MKFKKIVCLLAISGMGASALNASADVNYSIRKNPDGAIWTVFNNNGIYASDRGGYVNVYANGSPEYVYYEGNSVLSDNELAKVVAVNNNNVVLGEAKLPGQNTDGYLTYSKTGQYRLEFARLNPKSEINYQPLAFNDNLQTVGIGWVTVNNVQTMHAYSYDYKTGIGIDLTPTMQFEARANDINNSGAIVGGSYYDQNGGYLYVNGKMHSFDNYSAEVGNALPYSINDAGQIVASGKDGLYLLDHNKTTLLQSYGAWGAAIDLNEAGQVLAADYSSGAAAYYLYHNGKKFDLSTAAGIPAGWKLRQVFDLNDKGEVLASICVSEYLCDSVTITPDSAPVLLPPGTPTLPVPEPSSYAMMLAGLGISGVLARRNRRRQPH